MRLGPQPPRLELVVRLCLRLPVRAAGRAQQRLLEVRRWAPPRPQRQGPQEGRQGPQEGQQGRPRRRGVEAAAAGRRGVVVASGVAVVVEAGGAGVFPARSAGKHAMNEEKMRVDSKKRLKRDESRERGVRCGVAVGCPVTVKGEAEAAPYALTRNS